MRIVPAPMVLAVLTGLSVLALTGCSSSSSAGSAASSSPTAEVSGFALATPGAQASSAGSSADAGSSGGSTGSGSSTAAASPGSAASASPTALRYTKIVEPFSPPGTCNQNGTTLEITNCALEQVVDVDSTVNSLQQRRFEETPGAQQAGVLAEYAHWLSGRTTTCRAKSNTGGSIDQITDAQCLLTSSQDRVETLNDVG